MPIFVRVSVHDARIAAWLRDPANSPAQFVDHRTQAIENLAKIRCPVREGRLRSSIGRRVEVRGNSIVGSVGSPLDYAKYVHDGTGLYGPRRAWIYPTRAQVLVFTVRGPVGPLQQGKKTSDSGLVYARRVRGMPGSPFLTSALEDVMAGAPIRYYPR